MRNLFIFNMGYLSNSILIRLVGLKPMDDIAFPISLFILTGVSLFIMGENNAPRNC